MGRASNRKRKSDGGGNAQKPTTKPDEASSRTLKAWDDPAWKRKLSAALTVSRVDADIPTDKQSRNRKPWYIALTQEPDALSVVGGVDGLPEGKTLLLTEREIVALVEYLLEPQTAVWAEQPDTETPGTYRAYLFGEPGMVAIGEVEGDPEKMAVFNGEAHWTPGYFKREAETVERVTTPKVHTLPWPLEDMEQED